MASAGKQSSTSSIFSTGLNTWSAAKRSGRPLAAASVATDSEEVVLATSVASGSSVAEPAEHLALDRHVLRHGLHDHVALGQLAQVGDHRRGSPTFASAVSAERSLRAQTTTS